MASTHGGDGMVTMADQEHKRFQFPLIGVAIDVEMSDGKPIQVKTQLSKKIFDESFDPDRWAYSSDKQLSSAEASARRHKICNRLQIASMSLDILGQPIDVEDHESIEGILDIAIESLNRLEELAS